MEDRLISPEEGDQHQNRSGIKWKVLGRATNQTMPRLLAVLGWVDQCLALRTNE